MKNRDKAIAALDALRERIPRVCSVGDFILGLNRTFTRDDISIGIGVSTCTALESIRRLNRDCGFIFEIERIHQTPSRHTLVDCTFDQKKYLSMQDQSLIDLEDSCRGGVEIVRFPYRMPRAWKIALGIYYITLK